LIIDPVLVYSTFLGGAFPSNGARQTAYAVAADGVGNLYVAGYTDSSNFPVTPGVVGATSPNTLCCNAFVSKINPAGTSLIYSTYIAGMRNGVSGLAVDSLGNVYVAGAGSAGLPIPVGSIPFQATPKNLAILKLNNTGTAVLGGTYLGGSGTDFLGGLAVDPAGDVYLTGGTNSNDFPTQNAWQPALGITGSNSSNAFVTKLNPTMSGLVYSTYLGQSSNSNGTGIALDAARDAYVVGNADVGFPTTTGAFQTTATGPSAFLAKFNATGSLLYATYLSGASTPGFGASDGRAVAADSAGNVFVGGLAFSVNFPVLNPIQPCPSNATAAFLTEFNSAGSPSFSTCLGNLSFTAMSLDANGAVYLLGISDAGLSLKNPIDSNTPPLGPPAGIRSSVSEIDPVTRMLLFSSFIGGPVPANAGSPGDVLNAIAADLTGNIYVVGQSTTAGFNGSVPEPLSPIFNALQPLFGDTSFCNNRNVGCGYSDAIIMKISPNAGAAAAVSPSEVKFPLTQLATPSAPQPLTIYDLGTTQLTISNVSVSGDFAIQPSSCPMVAASGGSCVIQVTFTPTVTGARVGAVTITDSSPGSPHSVRLIGTGGQPLATPSPSSLSFPNQGINTTSSPQVVTITNGGTIDLQLSHIQVSAGAFSETNTCGTTITGGQSCNISVTFAPTNTGTFTGNITITDSAADSPQTVPLSGTGVNSLGLAVAPGGSNSATVAAGATASYTLSIGGSGISGTATLTCTGAPTGAVCSVPSTVSVSATTASTFNVSVSTSHAQSIPQAVPSPGRFGPAPWLWALAIIGCLFLLRAAEGAPVGRLRLRFAPLLALALFASGCGGSSYHSSNPTITQAGTYTLVVTAQSGNSTQSQNLTLTVQ
jgi:Abnormal spindle-like microcephaly-assoc'd, ASPM-SPD-2-Hydin/Beta-propeller repeat